MWSRKIGDASARRLLLGGVLLVGGLSLGVAPEVAAHQSVGAQATPGVVGNDGRLGFGQPATSAQIAAENIDVRPDGTGLPAGTPATIGNYWPYATTVYDYVNRAMPADAPGSLQPNEVYAFVAYLLSANEIIDSGAVMNAQSLPRVVMPNAHGFIPDPRPDVP